VWSLACEPAEQVSFFGQFKGLASPLTEALGVGPVNVGAGCRITRGARHTGQDQPEPEPVPGTGPTGTLVRLITDEGGAFDSDTATGMMPAAQRVASVLSSWRS
jgi:hypothetical protein